MASTAAGVAPVWFSLNRGAGGRDEVRRLLPLICRLGGARREQIGRDGEEAVKRDPLLSLNLLRAIGPAGRLVSFERREEFAQVAEANVETFFGEYPTTWSVVVGACWATCRTPTSSATAR